MIARFFGTLRRLIINYQEMREKKKLAVLPFVFVCLILESAFHSKK